MSAPHRYPHAPVDVDDWGPGRLLHIVLKAAGALLVIALIVAINVVLFAPPVRDRAEYLVLRVQTTVKRLRPHDRYVPTPVLTPTPAPALTPPPSDGGAAAAADQVTPTAPAPTETPVPTPTAPSMPSTLSTPPAPLPSLAQLETECHEPQGWNNCGPATLSMALCYYGSTEDQYVVAAATKPDKDDKNVGPGEMVAYTGSLGDMVAVMGYAADTDVLKRLLANGYPVIVETWFIPEPDDEMGHYRLLTGYDDATRLFATQDAYNGPDQSVPYEELEAYWKVFNRVYVVVAEAGRARDLLALLGDSLEPGAMHRAALAVALAEVAAHPDDRYAWFNAGTNYVGLGEHDKAAEAYDRARLLNLPWRMLWYQFGPFEAYLRVGRYQDVIDLADANLNVTPNLEESYYYRALARRALGDQAAARQDLETALRYNPDFERAAAALGD